MGKGVIYFLYTMRLFEKLPMEVEEQILMYLSSDEIIILGEDNVSLSKKIFFIFNRFEKYLIYLRSQ